MSELKAISGFEIRENIDYNTRGIDPEDKEWRNYGKELCETLYYIKTEADNVIAEKDKEIQRLENLCVSYRIDCDNLAIRETNAYKVIERDNKELRHHNYKRCLAMAEMCNARYDEEDAKENWCGLSWEYISKEMKYQERWRKRWLELAEKFKEAK